MRHLDRLARKQHRDAQAQTQAVAGRAQARESEEHQRVEREIRHLIPSTLRRLQNMTPEQSAMQSITYEVERVPLLGERCGWRSITRAAWEIGQWPLPVATQTPKTTPVWLLSNGLIGYNGLDDEPMVSTLASIAELWPTMLPIIRDGLREASPPRPRNPPSSKSNPAN